MAKGAGTTDETLTAYNLTPQEILRSLPGITSKNYKTVMNRVKTIRELASMSLAQIESLIGKENGRELHEFFDKNVLRAQ